MCKLCNSLPCPPNCPNHRQITVKKVVRCVLCGERITSGQPCYRANGFPYCENCLRFSDAESVIRICENDFAKGLFKLGFEDNTTGEWR